MQCSLEGTNTNIEKVADLGSCALLTNCVERDSCMLNAKYQEADGTVLKNSDQRCFFLSFTLKLDPSSRVRPPKHLGSRSQQKMEARLAYPHHTVVFHIDLQRSQGSQLSDPTCSSKPFPASYFSLPNILGQSQNRVLSKATKISTGPNDQVKKISKPVKKSGKKKPRKKGKQHKKPSNVELEAVHKEGNRGLSSFETCTKSDRVTLDGDYTEDKNGDLNEVSLTRRLSLSEVGPIDVEFSDSHMKETNNCDEIPIDIFSDYSPPVVDSFSDGWNSDGSLHGETRSITITEENFGINPLESGMVSDCSNCSTSSHSLNFGTGYLSRGSSCDASNSDARPVTLSKKGRHNKKSTGSSNGLLHRYGAGSNMHGWAGKENNHSVWQKVQRHDREESIYGRKKTEYSQADSQNRVSNTIDSEIFLPKEEVCRAGVEVSENLREKHIPGPEFESSIHLRKGLNIGKANSIKPVKRNMYQHESPEILWQVSQQQKKSLNVCRMRFPSQTCLDEAKPVATPSEDDNSGTILQKWIPVGRKDSGLLNPSRTNNFLTGSIDVSDAVEKIGQEELVSSAHSLVSPTDGEVSCSSPSFGNANFHSPSVVRACGMLDNCAPSSSLGNANSPFNLDYKTEVPGVSVYGSDSKKIVEAVRDAYRLQLASEGVQLVMGSPIAEFERLLLLASPVLGPTACVLPCKACLGDQMIRNSLCMHQIPNISLGGIWQWYEKPGSYGLEVKGKDYHNSKRLGVDRYEFRAYFVPYLSAVQLFHRSGSCLPTGNDMARKNRVTGNSSKFQDLPILSILLPKPRKAVEISMPRPANTANTLDSSGCGQDDEPELLFEYFESEQPQQRRPLFEKIKELVRGDGCSNCQVYGDPSNLDFLNLHDLHPSSWYSVAWYPIYRIPDGNFRAAFLTYHSLGHFIHQSISSDSPGGNTCVVSPVVGLQSYNAQGECWFAPKIQKEEKSSLDRSRILKERLRTLEQTAFTMARAALRKGNLKSVNRQSDFEFFVSRKR